MNQKLIKDIKNYVNYIVLPLDRLYYHQYDHALEVMQRAIYLGEKEGVSEKELEILAIAGLFHDTGFVIQYDNNEYIGAKIAKNYLRAILYPEDRIALIESLILITNPKETPQTLLEKILKDADLDNLGRDDFLERGKRLKHELELIKNIRIKDPDWRHAALDLIEGHTFYTSTQIRERNELLKKNTELLRSDLQNNGEE
ncbi:HD domain-containing protein [Candidatus Gracilibacteria bacterium]|nr:HD domain-containing protein [Candidatus Gracilibacteria bacterium]